MSTSLPSELGMSHAPGFGANQAAGGLPLDEEEFIAGKDAGSCAGGTFLAIPWSQTGKQRSPRSSEAFRCHTYSLLLNWFLGETNMVWHKSLPVEGTQ
jgi:hypothetical protein